MSALAPDLQESSLPPPIPSTQLPTLVLLLGCSWYVVWGEGKHIGSRVNAWVGIQAVVPVSIRTWAGYLASLSFG